MMEVRRATYGAAILLAMGLSIIAAVAAVILQTMGDVSAVDLVAVVALVGFTASWVQTGHIRRVAAARASHRVTVMPIRQSIG